MKQGLPLIISKCELTGREVVTCMHTRQRGRKDVGERGAPDTRVSHAARTKNAKNKHLFYRLIIRKQEEVLRFQKRKGTWRFLNNGLVFVAPLHNLWRCRWILTTVISDIQK